MFNAGVQFVADIAIGVFGRSTTEMPDEPTAPGDNNERSESRQHPSYAAATAARTPRNNDVTSRSRHRQTTNGPPVAAEARSRSAALPDSDRRPPARSGEIRAPTRAPSKGQADLTRFSSEARQLEGELSRMRDQHVRLERQAQDANKKLAEELQASRQREDAMSIALVEAERRLQALKAHDAATRVFAESEDVDGKAILDQFNDVVDCVNDFLFCVTDKLDENELMAVIQLERVIGLAKTNVEAANLLHAFLAPMSEAHAKVELVALLVMQATTFQVLCNHIFRPMSLAGQASRDAVQWFEHLRKCVSLAESQEKYGRWRAITYGAVRKPENDDQLAHSVALEIFRKLEEILLALLPVSSNRDGRLGQRLFGDLQAATKVVLDAIKLQDKIQRVYTSHDYYVYLPTTNVQFSAADMVPMNLGPDVTKELERAVRNARGARGTVLLPVMPGLRAIRVGQNHSDMELVVKKAHVVALL